MEYLQLQPPSLFWSNEYTGNSHQSASPDIYPGFAPVHPVTCNCFECACFEARDKFDGVDFASTADAIDYIRSMR